MISAMYQARGNPVVQFSFKNERNSSPRLEELFVFNNQFEVVFQVVEFYSSTFYPPSKEVYLLVFDSNKVLRYKYFKMFVML